MAAPKTKSAQKKINWQQFDKLCAIHCTVAEIADFFGISEPTLRRATQTYTGVTFDRYFQQKREGGNRSLRRKMYELAQTGNVTMLIWLSKQRLGYHEPVFAKVEHSGPDGGPIQNQLSLMTDGEIKAKLAECDKTENDLG